MKSPGPAVLVALLMASASHAEDMARSSWSLDGFGTLGAIHSSERHADYLVYPLRAEGPGRTGSWQLGTDSRLGAQISYAPKDGVSAVLQVIVEQGDNHPEAHVEWVNLAYDLTPDITVRAGRIVLQQFLATDYRNVGYALPWVRPPIEVYRLNPITHNDGIDVSYRHQWESWIYQGRLSYGGSRIEGDGQTVKTSHAVGFYNTLHSGALTLSFAYQSGRVDIPSYQALFDAFSSFGPEGDAVVRRYDVNGDRSALITTGASYDPGGWFLMGEYGQLNSSATTSRGRAGYVSAGVRWGAWTPYLTVAESRRRYSVAVAGLTAEAYPEPLAPVAAALNAALQDILRSTPVQRTFSAGARWDLRPGVALKAQYDHVDVNDGSNGTFGNLEAGYLPDQVSLFSFALDFVF